MGLRFEELDEITREHMLTHFRREEASDQPYRSPGLTARGLDEWPKLMEVAIKAGDDDTLTAVMKSPVYWKESEIWIRNGVARERHVNVGQAAERLAVSEFNTWYVRGLGARLITEGVDECEVYRAAEPKWEVAGCSEHEGKRFPVQVIIAGHRARYWPTINDSAFSIPVQPGCHHTIRRIAL